MPDTMKPEQTPEAARTTEDRKSLDTLAADIQQHIVTTLGMSSTVKINSAISMGWHTVSATGLSKCGSIPNVSTTTAWSSGYTTCRFEFLPGRFLMNYITNMGMEQGCREVLEKLGLALEDIEEVEWDAGLGNGGLGRLASCYMDSIASLRIPGYGYGILYDYGIFYQNIVNGYQEESCDNWRRQGNPWEIIRRELLYEVNFYGRSEAYLDAQGRQRYRWVDTRNVMAMPCDILIPGYGCSHVTNMRLWAAQSSRDFNLSEFNRGDYIGAMHDKVISENISKVLYPNDELEQGKELRLKQQYFLVAATIQDIMRRHKKQHSSMEGFADHVAVQLNDTHPSIAIAELMRLLLDVEMLPWEQAWDICTRTFAYTNHTVLPEALETWPVELIGRLLPRHLEIICEIDRRFLLDVAARYPGDAKRLQSMSIVGGEMRGECAWPTWPLWAVIR